MLYSVILFAQNSPYTSSGSSSPDATLSFIENKGQWPEQVLFKARLADHLTVYFEQSGWTLCMYDAEDMHHSHAHHDSDGHNHKLRGHAVKVRLPETNAIAEGVGMKEEKYNYLNFGTSSSAKNVRAFKEIIYKNLWPNIDLRFYCSPGTRLKYEFILSEGADINKIRLEYSGQESMAIENGHLVIGTSLDEITELKPIAWTGDGQQKDHLSCSYQLTDNLLTFQTDEYPKESKMVIDPELVFSTYTGSLSDNWGFSATDDLDGNVYSGGIVSGGGYPVSPGAFQEEFAGNWDIAIIKYTPDGTQRLFATLLGGSYADLPHSLIVNKNNELLIFGTTGSPDFPITPSAYDTSFNGGANISYDGVLNFPFGVDLFVARLSEDGSQLLSSTFIGGSGNDGLNYRSRYAPFLMHGNDSLYYNYGDGARGEIITDDQNNVYIGSCTFSTDFPVSTNAFQSQSAGMQEGIVLKMDAGMNNLLWSSYLGGSSDDAVYSVDIDSQNRLFATGGTTSGDFPTTSNAWKSTFQGGTTDAFLTCIQADGSSLYGSTFYGSNAYDQSYFVRLSRDDEVFIYGQTKASDNSLIINNPAYAQSNSGQFIAKFPAEMDQIYWSSVFGTGNGEPNISPTAFAVDMCNRIYVSGWGRIWGNYTVNGVHHPWGSEFGTVGMDITADAAQNTTDGQDFYIAVFASEMADLEYGSFFGELHYSNCYYSGHDHVDGGTSRFDKKGHIYQSVCASCGNCQQFPTWPNPGAWSNTNNGGNCNNAVFKIHVQSDFAYADFKQPEPGCTVYTVDFENLSQGTEFLWNFGDPASGSNNTSIEENPSHIYTQAGSYSIQLIAFMPGGCYPSDTTIRQLLVMNDTSYFLPDTGICLGNSIQIGLDPVPDTSIHYLWQPSAGLNDTLIANPIASPTTSTLYTLVVSNGYCADTIRQWIYVSELYIDAGADTSICQESWQLIGHAWPEPVYYLWSNNPEFSDTLNTFPDDSTAIVQITGSQCFYLQSASIDGCIATDTICITAATATSNIPKDTTACMGDTLAIHAGIQSTNGIASIHWEPENMIISGQGSPDIECIAPYDYALTLNMVDSSGCVFGDTTMVHTSEILGKTYIRNPLCSGLCNGEIRFEAFGGLPPYHYQWSNGATTAEITGLCAGTYHLIITDSALCQSEFDFVLLEPAPFFIIEALSPPSCYGKPDASIEVFVNGATPPYEYLWSNGATVPFIENLIPGEYNLTITDSAQCDTTLYFTIEQAGLFQIIDSIKNPTCHDAADGFIKVWVNGSRPPYEYFWNGIHGTDSLGGISAGTYELLITDTGNCDSLLVFEISAPDAYSIQSEIGNARCYGSEDGSIALNINGASPPYTIEWSNGQNSAFIDHLSSGLYTAHITDSLNCDTTVSLWVSEPDSLYIIADLLNPLCYGSQNGHIFIEAFGGTPPYTFQWSNGAITPEIEELGSGTYELLLTDNNACSLQQNFILNETPNFNILSEITAPLCHNSSDGSIHLELDGATKPYSFLWSDGSTEQNLSSISSGIYTVLISDAHECDTSLEFSVLAPSNFDILIKKENIACYGQATGRIEVGLTGGSPPYNFHWEHGAIGPILENLTAGTYNLQITDAHECDTLLQIMIEAPESGLTCTAEITHCRCFGSSDGTIRTSISGGTPPYIFEWDNGQSTTNIDNLSSGTYSLHIIDALLCDSTISFTVDQPSAIEATAEITDASCYFGRADGSIKAVISGGTKPYTYIWSDGQQSLYINQLSRGLYKLNITDSSLCTKNAFFTVGSPDSIQLDADVKNIRCFGEQNGEISIQVSGGLEPYRILWSNGEEGRLIYDLAPGNYSLELTDDHGCKAQGTYWITEPEELLLGFHLQEVVCIGRSNGSIESNVDGGTEPYSYVWNTGSMEADLYDIPAGEYSLVLSDYNGCSIEKSCILTEKPCDLVIPNVITPNGDGFNDFFVITNISYYPGNELLIFNRWGKEIASYTNYQNDWDGIKNDGSRAADGVYYFILRIPGEEQVQGSITILH